MSLHTISHNLFLGITLCSLQLEVYKKYTNIFIIYQAQVWVRDPPTPLSIYASNIAFTNKIKMFTWKKTKQHKTKKIKNTL